MKKTIILSFILLFASFAQSQTIEEAKEHIYYTRYDAAEKVLQSIIVKENPSPDAWYWLGEIYLKQLKPGLAEKALQAGKDFMQKQDLAPKQYPLLSIGWAHLLLDTGKVQEARSQMEDILKQTKYKNATVLLAAARANIESKNGDAAWALELLKKAAKRDKKNPEVYAAAGDAHRKLIHGSDAVVSFGKANDVDPSFAEAMYKKGLIYKSQNNIEIYIDRFKKAYAMDSNYTPVLYELYYFYFYRDIAKAGNMLEAYLRNADPDAHHAYMQTDYYYVSKKYDEAIRSGKDILAKEGNEAKPRIYKLIAYSYAATGDSATALQNMDIYFEKQKPSEVVVKDYELKARLLEKLNPDKLLAIEWYKKALAAESEKKEKLGYMITVAEMQKELGNRDREAMWRESIYTTKDRPSNLDIFNWGVALYSGENYVKADSVFKIYAEKYPDQLFGYVWRARCNAVMDSTMEKGLAVPYYKKLTEMGAKDSKKNKTTLMGAYGYLGAYEANITKDYAGALVYFDKMLELEPTNSDAAKFADMLRNWINEGKASN